MSKLALICGDPAGVGPEIIAAWLVTHHDEAGSVAIIGPARWLATRRSATGTFCGCGGRPTDLCRAWSTGHRDQRAA